MIAQLISLPISVILFIWMLRIKKNDPFPKGSVFKMLLTGALCTFGSAIVTILLALLVALVSIGPASSISTREYRKGSCGKSLGTSCTRYIPVWNSRYSIIYGI